MQNKNIVQTLLSTTICSTLFCWRCNDMRTLSNNNKISHHNQENFQHFALKKIPSSNMFETLDLFGLYQCLFEDKILRTYDTICASFSIASKNNQNKNSCAKETNVDEVFSIDQLFGPISVPILNALYPTHPIHLVYATFTNKTFDINLLSPMLSDEIRVKLPIDAFYNGSSNSFPKISLPNSSPGQKPNSFRQHKSPLLIYAQALLCDQNLYKKVINDLTQQTIKPGKIFKTFSSDEEIKQKFDELETRYNYYDDSKKQEARSAFVKAFKVAKIVEDYIEKHGELDDCLAYDHAYKMLLCFNSIDGKKQEDMLRRCDAYFKKYYKGKPSPMRNAFAAVILPSHGNHVTLSKWQAMIRDHGPSSMKLFQKADLIEEYLANQDKKCNQSHKAPTDFKQAKEILSRLKFSNSNKNFELALVASDYPEFTQEDFDTSIEVLERRKTVNNLPDIPPIDGSKIGHTGFWFLKLPISDPRACLLGHITHCCQSINRDSHQCVVDGITLPNNGFYVLLKTKIKINASKGSASITKYPKKSDGSIDYGEYQIVGQGYAWRSKNGNLTFDSWENLRNECNGEMRDDAVIFDMLQKFGREVINNSAYGINRVTIGLGGKTPAQYKFSRNKKVVPETMLEGRVYVDSIAQGIVYDAELSAIHDVLCKKWNLDFDHFLSMRSNKSSQNNSIPLSDVSNNEPKKLSSVSIGGNKTLLSAILILLESQAITTEDIESLYNLERDKCKLLCSDVIINYIINHGFSFKDFKNLDTQSLALICENQIELDTDEVYDTYNGSTLTTLYWLASITKFLKLERIMQSNEVLLEYKDLIKKSSEELNSKLEIISKHPVGTKRCMTRLSYSLVDLIENNIHELGLLLESME